MARVWLAGVTGWTAPPIVAAIDAADDLTLTAGVSRSAAGQKLSLVTTSTSDGKVYAPSPTLSTPTGHGNESRDNPGDDAAAPDP